MRVRACVRVTFELRLFDNVNELDVDRIVGRTADERERLRDATQHGHPILPRISCLKRRA